jgi:hypothetical protein
MTPHVREPMNTEHLPHMAPDSSAAPQPVPAAEIKQVIEHVRVRYLADLRAFREELYQRGLATEGETSDWLPSA